MDADAYRPEEFEQDDPDDPVENDRHSFVLDRQDGIDFERRRMALEVLKLYPYRLNDGYDAETSALLKAARDVVIGFLREG